MNRTDARPLWLPVLVLCLGACGPPEPTGISAAGQLRLGGVLGEGFQGEEGFQDEEGFQRADRVLPFEFPRDHGAHPNFRSEWWYLTLILTSSDGDEFGAQFTLFRQALRAGPDKPDNRWQTPQIYLAHFALTDVARNAHRAHERIARGHPQLAGSTAQPLRVWLEDWVLGQVDSQPDTWLLSVSAEGDALEVELDVSVPVVLQGDRGLSAKGPQQASYYYSMPGMPVRGTLTSAGRSHQVSGSAWLDREWSTSVLGTAQVGWDWFALEFVDGRKLMVFQLRRRDGSRDLYDQGILIDADGASRALGADDFELTPRRFWTDAWGVAWPIEWQLSIGSEELHVAAAVDDQRMPTAITYWEGLVDVFEPDGAGVGRGYLELTGYDDGRSEEGSTGDE